ncbi:amino acid adenylation domain-containing protein [Streptomyces hygroscopicus]|uniref:amino acid adenylation domain-containing protein n=1 Tax=Streptomyces hygroscopicus TaxID=1912 RepID=UPI0008263E21|nr:amino acid adenylation domain-containing protein [Streptomyces hygroscopicus]
MNGRCLHEIFADREREVPERTAVTAPDGELTYAELGARARALAARLTEAGVSPGTLVGLCAHRGTELVVGVLGILMAGGAYVPLDPDYPPARLGHLLDDTKVPVVAATDRAARALPDGTVAEIVPITAPGGGHGAPETTPAALGDDSLAYVIHTSGSTGQPKGVLVEHRNVVRLFTSSAEVFGFGPQDVWTLFHSMSFDFSVWEIWGALLHGGRLVVVPQETTRIPADLLALLAAERVTVLSQTPSAFRQLAAADEAAAARRDEDLALRLVVFGGERLDVREVAGWLDRHGDERPRLVNMYGITETCVHVTHREIRTADLREPGHSPIGVPLPDLDVWLLDAEGCLVPDGKPGEIWVSGAGVTRGYLNRPELTAERFVTRSLGGAPAVRCYRSGDLAVRTAEGELRYLGRNDDQLKVRGYRIEPHEVEECLLGHPAVTAAVVVDHDHGDGDVRLAAFVVPGSETGAADRDALPERLAELAATVLPRHLRPAEYRVADAIPLTPQGKTDRAALRRLLEHPPGEARPSAGGPQEAEGTRAVVSAVVGEVLGNARTPGPDTDLFEVGATSLAFVRIIAGVNEHFGLELTGSELDGEATIARIAASVEERVAHRADGRTTTHDTTAKERK